MTNKGNIAVGVGFILASACSFGLYFSKPNIPEAEVLASTAAYVQNYEEKVQVCLWNVLERHLM